MGALPSPQIIGRYGIYGKIASGGMASVHFGRLLGAVGFSRTVAIKRLHPHLAEDQEFNATMIDEARLAARIHHPNVVPTLDVVALDGELLVIMEYVRGESLSRLLRAECKSGRRIPLPIASAIVIGALHGLHAAHEATSDRGAPLGIVHRDVSPQNILVGIDGLPRVIDFGVAKAAGRLQTTREGVLKGKMAYMAPEQLAGSEATRSVDVYGMGVVLWEMLAGKRLFSNDNEGGLFGDVLAGAKDPPSRYAPNLPAALDALVMTALALEPRNRFASAKDMAERLLRVVPPAFPTDVGAWVEAVAHDAIEQRGVALAEIESSSSLAGAPPSARASRSRTQSGRTDATPPGASEDSARFVPSQPSSLAVETPSGVARPWRGRRAGALGGAAALLTVIVSVLVWRGSGTTSHATSGASAQPTETAAPQASERVPAPSNEIPSVDVSTLPAASAAPTAAPAPRPASPASPPSPVRSNRPRPAACDPPFYFDANGIKHYKRECN